MEKKALILLLEISKIADQKFILVEKSELIENDVCKMTASEVDSSVTFLKDEGYINVKYSDDNGYFLAMTDSGREKVIEVKKIIEEREAERKQKEIEDAQKRHFGIKKSAKEELAENETKQIGDNEYIDLLPDTFTEVIDNGQMLPAVQNKPTKNIKVALISAFSGFAGGILGGLIMLIIAFFI